jgi:hypothetical protein
VEVRGLQVRLNGAGDFAAAVGGVSLFEDVDRDGVWSAPDRELAPVAAFDPGTLTAVLAMNDALVGSGESRRWILRLHPAAGVPPSGKLRLEISDATSVDEFYWEPPGMTGVQAVFPLQSAEFEAGPVVDPRAAWREGFGLPADGSGIGADDADPDNDGLVNLIEYALGSSPVDPNDATLPAAERLTGPDRLALSYQKIRDDILYRVEASAAPDGPWSEEDVDQGGPGPAVTASILMTAQRAFLRLKVLSP